MLQQLSPSARIVVTASSVHNPATGDPGAQATLGARLRRFRETICTSRFHGLKMSQASRCACFCSLTRPASLPCLRVLLSLSLCFVFPIRCFHPDTSFFFLSLVSPSSTSHFAAFHPLFFCLRRLVRAAAGRSHGRRRHFRRRAPRNFKSDRVKEGAG